MGFFRRVCLRTIGRAVLLASLGCGAPPSPVPLAEPAPVAAPVITVARLAPEQLSNFFIKALGTDYGVPLDGEPNPIDPRDFYSYVTRDFAVSLGGVNFLARVRDRDPLAKVQTLLVTRAIAWPLAVQLVQEGLEVPQRPDSLFLRCNIAEDRPTGDDAARARWEDQLHDFYLRLYSRRATPEEVAAVADTFERVATREQNTGSAWLVTLYALLGSLETWHTWR